MRKKKIFKSYFPICFVSVSSYEPGNQADSVLLSVHDMKNVSPINRAEFKKQTDATLSCIVYGHRNFGKPCNVY